MTALIAVAMDPDGWPQLVFRWIHVVAGVLWIGLLYFFNWVNAPFEGTLDPETKKKVVPELRPRALFWFRWGAAWTFVSGLLLAGLLYVHSPVKYFAPLGDGGVRDPLIAMGGLLVGFVVYDALAKALAKQNHLITLSIWGIIAIGYGCWLESVGASQRAIYIHMGALFGTAMAANVWMRIWPAQRRIITAIKGGQKPADADPALAGARSRHNVFMSIPLLLWMVSIHQTVLTSVASNQVAYYNAGILAVGFAAAHVLFGKAPNVKGF